MSEKFFGEIIMCDFCLLSHSVCVMVVNLGCVCTRVLLGIAESLHQEAKSKKVPYLAYQEAYNNHVASNTIVCQ